MSGQFCTLATFLSYLKEPSIPNRSEWVFFPPGLFSSSVLYNWALNENCVQSGSYTLSKRPGEPIFLVGSFLHPVVSDLCKGPPSATVLTWQHLRILTENTHLAAPENTISLDILRITHLGAQIVDETFIFPNWMDVVHFLEHFFRVGKKHVEEALNLDIYMM